MGIFGGRFKMGRPNPNIWVWVNRRLGIFGDHPLRRYIIPDAYLVDKQRINTQNIALSSIIRGRPDIDRRNATAS